MDKVLTATSRVLAEVLNWVKIWALIIFWAFIAVHLLIVVADAFRGTSAHMAPSPENDAFDDERDA